MMDLNLDPAPIMQEVPERCEACTTNYQALRPIVRPVDGGLKTVGYHCTKCGTVALYRES